jgi:hypothetical protein
MSVCFELKNRRMIRMILILSIILTLTSCGEGKSAFNNSNSSDAKRKGSFSHVDKNVDLFWIRDLVDHTGQELGFISLSDIYTLSEHADSLAIPLQEEMESEDLQYIPLTATYRNRFLAATNISETDSVFIYDYSTNVLLAFPVHELEVVANLNMYTNADECPCSQYEYMIGFEVAKNKLTGLSAYFYTTLVAVGAENPFVKGQLKPVVWEKINPEKFPSKKSKLTPSQTQYTHKNARKGPIYFYEIPNYQIFVQDYTDSTNTNFILDRHVLVIDKNSGKLTTEFMLSESESASLVTLPIQMDAANELFMEKQWAGKLLKNQPEVIFGFESVSFGCPRIDYLNSNRSFIRLNCDNRH